MTELGLDLLGSGVVFAGGGFKNGAHPPFGLLAPCREVDNPLSRVWSGGKCEDGKPSPNFSWTKCSPLPPPAGGSRVWSTPPERKAVAQLHVHRRRCGRCLHTCSDFRRRIQPHLQTAPSRSINVMHVLGCMPPKRCGWAGYRQYRLMNVVEGAVDGVHQTKEDVWQLTFQQPAEGTALS